MLKKYLTLLVYKSKLREMSNSIKTGFNESNMYKTRHCIICDVAYIAGTTSKKCPKCLHKSNYKKSLGNIEARKILADSDVEKKCFFCGKTENIHIHHVDRDSTNNNPKNIMLLCQPCHTKVHGKIYNPLLKRVFKILTEERFSYEAIGDMFNTTRQNVYKLLKQQDLQK